MSNNTALPTDDQINEVLEEAKAQAEAEAKRDIMGGNYFATIVDSQTGRKSKKFMPVWLAQHIVENRHLAKGVDGRFWSYDAGVWGPDDTVIRDEVVKRLQNSYQVGHTNTVRDIIASQVEEITCDPIERVINFKNGLLDWRTGELGKHTPAIKSTVQMAVEYKPEAECPEFEKFLTSVVPEDVVDMVWELIGYMMYSGNPLHKAVMFHGQGRNGKGTLIRAIQGVIGKRNTTAVTLQAITEERFAGSSLFGKLANIAGDIDGTYMEKTARFKAITGLDEITVEFKGRDSFEFTPYAVPLFSANKIPGSADVTSGYLDRWVVVPFPHNFTGREDRGLDGRIAEELEGIAAKAIPALQRLMERGNFSEPESAQEAMNDFKRKVDQVRTWAEDCAELDAEAGHVSRSEMYAHYKEWAKDGGIGQLKNSEFFERVEALGCVQAKIKGIRGFKGIRIVALPSGEPLEEERSPFQDS